MAFVITDVMGTADLRELSTLCALRLVLGLFLVRSALHIRRTHTCFKGYHQLCLWNQLAAAIILIMLGTVKALPFIHPNVAKVGGLHRVKRLKTESHVYVLNCLG